MLKLLDLFSGIGGFSLGMEATNRIKTIAFVEKDKFCQKVLNKNFKNIPIEEDIRNVKGSNYTADIVSGGFPCQPFSVAGKRRGKDDDRYLWDETIRVVAETKPKYFVGENVEGIINISNGTVLQQIQQDLEKEGFQVQCLVIPASGVGAWHQRKRVWIIGCNLSNANSNGPHTQEGNETKQSSNQSKEWLFIRDDKNVPNTSSQRPSSQSIREHRELEKESQRKKETRNQSSLRTSSSCSDVPNTNEQRTQIQAKGKHTSIKMSGSSSKESWWETQSKLCGIPYGLSARLDKDRTNRIKALGNSIVPLIAYEIGKAIISAEDQSD
jgi:DNA (cytosine-5)-methyltransferase 1